MYIFLYLFLLIISILLQLTIAPLFSIKTISPDFILILVIFIAFQKGRIWGVVVGCIAGLLFDIFGTGFIGLSSLTKSIAAYAAGFMVREQLERQFGRIIGLLLIVILIHDLIYFSVISLGTNIGFWNNIFKHVFPTTIYTFIFMIIIHLLKPKVH